MFYFASKMLAVLTWLSNLILMFGFVGAVLLATRYARAGLRCLLASLLLLGSRLTLRPRALAQKRISRPDLPHPSRGPRAAAEPARRAFLGEAKVVGVRGSTPTD
jgi:hypothetical protein